MMSYEYTKASTVTDLNIQINYFYLFKSWLYGINFINLSADSRILNLMMNMLNSVIESSFTESSFIKESKVINKGSINLNNVTFII